MKMSISARFGGVVALGALSAVAASTLVATAQPAWAKKAPRVAVVGHVEPPFGLQGQGPNASGPNVGIIFNLIDESRRKTDVEVQWGVDRNCDGAITDDEYQIATEKRDAPGNTRKDRAPQLFTTSGDIGAAQQFVWKSLADVNSGRYLTFEYELDLHGRPVPDPDNPGSYKFRTGPDGVTPLKGGVRIRVRAVRSGPDPVTGRRTKLKGDWTYSDADKNFSLTNNNPPAMKIDSVDDNGVSVPTASDENVHIHWSVSDPDSEDANGNGQLDLDDLEDVNGNGALDAERVGVAFDYHRVAVNETPDTMTPAQLDALAWQPCSRAVNDAGGQTDEMSTACGVVEGGLPTAPPGVGRSWVFSWDSVKDVGTGYAKFIFRAMPFDEKREHGTFAYFKTPVQLDNWKIFNAGSTNFPVASLASGRVGQTVTHMPSAVDTNDPLDRGDVFLTKPFQSFLVAGGAASIDGGGVRDLDVISVNTIAAETSTSARVPLQLGAARAYHTATYLNDGRVLFTGGFGATGTPLATTEVYDPKTRSVSPGPNLATARARHAAVLLSSGDVAVF